MGLGPHLLSEQDPQVHRRGVVHLGQLESKISIGPGLFRIAEQTEGNERDVDVAAREGGVDRRGMRCVIASIKIDFGDRAAQFLQFSGGSGATLGGAGGQHHPQPGACVSPGQGDGDVRGASQQQQGLRYTDCVDHGRPPSSVRDVEQDQN
jgi:hypothetical protein